MTGTTRISRGAHNSRLATLTTAALGVLTLAFGLWAFLAPVSFFEVIAPFEPYNRHLVHDAGALQAGVGAALLLATAGRSAHVVALGGFIAFEALHVVSHFLDRDLGGNPVRDITFLVVLALVGVAALLARTRDERLGGPPSDTASTEATHEDHDERMGTLGEDSDCRV